MFLLNVKTSLVSKTIILNAVISVYKIAFWDYVDLIGINF